MKIFNKNFSKKAFSLIELSVVLVIISVLIAGTLSVSITSINNAKAKVTNDKIKAIYQSMGAFLLKNYRLPCPANLTLAKITSGYGAEIGSQGGCSGTGVYLNTVGSGQTASQVAYGMVPVTALGLSADMAEDAYGNKIAYAVGLRFTKAEYPTATAASPTGFSYTSTAATNIYLIQVIEQPSTNVVDGIIFALISAGQNKFGAFSANSTAQNTAPSDTHEIVNYPNVASGTTATYGNSAGHTTRITFASVSASSDVFDDVVFFKTRENMLADFDAQFLVPCAGFTANGHTYVSAYYGTLVQSSTGACTAPASVRPSFRCSTGGTFQAVDTCTTY